MWSMDTVGPISRTVEDCALTLQAIAGLLGRSSVGLNLGAGPLALANAYLDSGAAAISVLTEADHFQGSLEHMALVKEAAHPKGVPVLRKDFIFDEYQVYEARAYGADAFLLIVAAITDAQRRADDLVSQQMGGMMGGLKIPGLT